MSFPETWVLRFLYAFPRWSSDVAISGDVARIVCPEEHKVFISIRRMLCDNHLAYQSLVLGLTV